MRGMSKGREMGRSVYEQPGNEVDGSYHSKEGSKLVKGDEWGAKGNEEKGKQRARGLVYDAL
jgi:hypothetical protein